MGFKDTTTINNQIRIFEVVLKINNFLMKFKLGSKKLKSYEKQFNKMKKQAMDLLLYPQKYNEYFSLEGFISYSSMNFDIMKEAVDLYENDNKDGAKKCIMAYYSSENIEKQMLFLRHMSEFENRMKYINLALEDYKNERYYAVVPILLMMIDGIISDIVGKGFHSDKNNLDAWDSLVVQNNGLEAIKNIFTKSRKKTTVKPIALPYRHGILHGRDLGYDNYEVALKCWVMLFAIRDFVIDKKNEKERKSKFEEKTKPISLRKIVKDIHELNKTKKLLFEWKPRELDQVYIDKLNEQKSCVETEPEYIVIQHFDFWLKSNYGGMAKIENVKVHENIKQYAGVLKRKYTEIILNSYKILEIIDEAPAITQIKVILFLNYYGLETKKITDVRCIYQSNEKEVQSRGYLDGNWFIMPMSI